MGTIFSGEESTLANEELQNILTSDQFANAPIVRAFLEFVVTETVSGRGDRLKAYTIAVEGFGRSPEFDPSSDTIVRTTAGRVRRALEAYYRTSGAASRIVISLPKGGYTPSFAIRGDLSPPELASAEPPEPSPGEPATPEASKPDSGMAGSPPVRLFPLRRGSWLLACGLAVIAIGLIAFLRWAPKTVPIPENLIIDVQHVEYVGEQAGLLAREIDIRLAPALSRIRLAEIVPPGASVEMAGRVPTTRHDPGNSIIFDLTGSITNDAAPELIWKLRDTASNRLLWSSKEPLSGLAAAPIDVVVDRIAFKILGVGGGAASTFERYRGDILSRPTCLFRAQIEETTANDVAYAQVRDCLERIVRESPNDASAWAVLSNLYSVRSLYYLSGTREERASLVASAEQAAQRAAELAPESYLTKTALMRLSYRQRKTVEFDALQKEIRKDYPGDVYSHIFIATRLTRLGQGASALEIFDVVRTAFGLNLKNWSAAITIAYYADANYQQAYHEMSQITSDLEFTLALRAAILGKLNRADEAAPFIQKLVAIDPNIRKSFSSWLIDIGWSERLVRDIADGLAKAGFPVDP